MTPLLDEILEIPGKAELCYDKNQGIRLPLDVPYLGMGSSYNAAVTLSYCGARIYPYTSSEYFYYTPTQMSPLGVLISQSGESSETLWDIEHFKKIIAITNQPESSLAKAKNVQSVIELYADDEQSSSTKTYVNTLIALYLGFGIDPRTGIHALRKNFNHFQHEAMRDAQSIAKRSHIKGLYILGSGPNSATAAQGALVLSEVTKLAWVGMTVAEYDHGPKEAAENTVVIFLNSHGRDAKRIEAVKKNLKKHSNAFIIELIEKQIGEVLSPLPFIVQLNFLANSLADNLRITETYRIGRKITTVPDSTK